MIYLIISHQRFSTLSLSGLSKRYKRPIENNIFSLTSNYLVFVTHSKVRQQQHEAWTSVNINNKRNRVVSTRTPTKLAAN